MKRTHTRRDVVTSTVVGAVLILVGLVAADGQLSWGFTAYTAVILIIAGLLFLKLPRWRVTRCDQNCRQPTSPWVHGAIAGLAVWLVTVLFPFTHTPRTETTFADYVIGAAGTSAVFAALAALLARYG